MNPWQGTALKELNIGVLGAGYVGLATGACLAHVGHRITLVDVDARRVESLERGMVPI
jgi:UDPglucose 6-dehydrogenase